MRVQRKLAVGAADDPAEHEADRLADLAIAALRGNAGERGGISFAATSRIARSSTAAAGFELDTDTEQRIHAARSDRRAMPSEIQRSMEAAFGADFSDVRLHVGAESDALNDRIQARAFTLGSDVFVRRSDYAPASETGRKLLAHELAHTIQQGASRTRRSDSAVVARTPSAVQPVIRRSPALDIVNSVRADLDRSRFLLSKDQFDPKKFKVSTNTRGHQRGASLEAIDAYLVQYQPLANDPSKNAERLKLLIQMQYAAEQWILDHSVKDVTGSRALKKERTTGVEEAPSNEWIIDPDRKGRFAGIAFFLDSVTIEVANTKRVMADTDTDDQTLEKVEAAAGGASGTHKKLKAKYEGDPTSTLTKLGALVEMAVPNEGDQSEIEVAFRWPVDPSGVAFVGGTLRLTAQNASPPGTAAGVQGAKNILARAELVFTFGAQWLNIGKIQAEIGGYIESSAKTGRETMTLMSYLLYRKCRESYVMPREVTSFLWGGGRKGTFGAIKSEQWSKDVETAIIGDNENAYAQSGLVAGVGAEGQLGNDQIGGGGSLKVSGGSGTRYDKASIEKVKQLGAANERSDKATFSTAQKELGRGVRFLVVEVGGNVGPFKGQAQVRLQWEDDGPTGYAIKGAELEFQAGAKVPNVGGDELGERIAGWATEGVKTLVSKVRAAVGAQADKQKIKDYEAQQLKVKGGAPPAMKMTTFTEKERGEAVKGSVSGEIFGSVLDALDQLRNISAVETLVTPSPDVDPTWLGGAADDAPSNFHDQIRNSERFSSQVGERSLESSIGLTIALGGDLIGKVFQLSFNFEKERQFSIPMFLDISHKATTRLVAFRYETGKWTIL